MFVKICGITNREDALAAIDSGARALGFIFHPPSPRYVTPEALEPWLADIPEEIWKVGVFVNQDPRRIEQIAMQLHLDVAQLHGNETPDRHPHNLRIWKAFRVNGKESPPPSYPAEAILLDGPASGQTFNWEVVGQVSDLPVLAPRLILAGGLTPENVRAAIHQTHPWGVDTASGVESSPGRKDHARMKMFIEAALRS
jgi:phosphoribosylanthranilate isomerase